MKGARSAFGLLTVLGGSAPPDAAAVAWFPFVGAVVGAFTGLAHRGAGAAGGLFVAVAAALVVDAVVTGLLHHDGLVDTADGLLPHHLDRERRLALMREPTVGAFGAVSAGLVVVVRALLICALPISWLTVACFVFAASVARLAMATLLERMQPAREAGMAAMFSGRPGRSLWSLPPVALGIVALAASDLRTGWAAVGAVASVALVTAAIARRSGRLLGGVTGDVLGCTCLLGETAALAAFAVAFGSR